MQCCCSALNYPSKKKSFIFDSDFERNTPADILSSFTCIYFPSLSPFYLVYQGFIVLFPYTHVPVLFQKTWPIDGVPVWSVTRELDVKFLQQVKKHHI